MPQTILKRGRPRACAPPPPAEVVGLCWFAVVGTGAVGTSPASLSAEKVLRLKVLWLPTGSLCTALQVMATHTCREIARCWAGRWAGGQAGRQVWAHALQKHVAGRVWHEGQAESGAALLWQWEHAVIGSFPLPPTLLQPLYASHPAATLARWLMPCSHASRWSLNACALPSLIPPPPTAHTWQVPRAI